MNKFLSLILAFIVLTVPAFGLDYDFSNPSSVKIPLKILDKITTAKVNKSYEGQRLKFVVLKDVYYNNQLLVKKDTIATARLEIMTTRGFAGVPGEIFITDFNIPNLDSRKFIEPISKRGFSTTTLILPIKWALTPFPPFGSITNVFVGGNATLTPKKCIYLEYFPEFEFE